MFKDIIKSWLGIENNNNNKIADVEVDWDNNKNKFNEEEAIQTYSNNVWVGACVLLRGNTFADTKFYIENEKEEKILNHPLLELINKPSNSLTGFNLLRLTAFHLDLTGNAFWRYSFVNRKIVNIQILQPDKVKILIDEKKGVTGYKYLLNGKQIKLSEEEVTHFQKPNPLDSSRGISSIYSAKYQVDTDKHSNIWNYNFFKNGASAGTIIESPNTLMTEVKKRIINKFNAIHQGSKNSHKTVVLDGGLKMLENNKTHKDMQFSELQTDNRDKILATYQVPKILIGQFEGGSLAEARTAKDIFAENVIDPMLRSFCEVINLDLMPLFSKDDNLKIKFESKVVGDKKFEEDKKNKAVNIWMTINERRAKEGLEPIQGGDTLYQPINLIPLGAEMQTSNTEEDNTEDNDKRLKEKAIKEKINKKLKSKEFKEEFGKKYLITHQKYEDKFIKKIVRAFNIQQKTTLQSLQNMKNYKYKKSLTDDVFDYEKNKDLFLKLFPSLIGDIFVETGNNQSTIFNLGVELTTDTAGVKKEIDRMTLKFAQEVNNTTKKRLRDKLNEGIAEGESIDELSKRVKTVFTEAKTSRAKTISRTEVTKATNGGALKTYTDSDVVDTKEWLATAGARDTHSIASGQEKNTGEAFDVGGDKLKYPGDPSGSPEEVINCRCTVLPVVK